ncbi:MAG: threonine synthase [Bacteroidia bacterium]|nr:threonine synthase [Bacteroidia bacterium]
MKLHSTKNHRKLVSLKEAVLKSLPDDNGLYVPQQLLRLPDSFISELSNLEISEINYQVVHHLIGDDIPDGKLREIVEEAINFPAPVVHVHGEIYCLELYHGPTLAFKDFGARFMARLMGYFMENEKRHLHILVATSGDTGGAVASGFYDVDGITVTILYPSGKVSPLQEKQLTTLGKNIRAIEVEGSFDDCQALVKKAFLDQDLKDKLLLSSANSINIARLIPQTLYYFQAVAQLDNNSNKVALSVPSGNFGNLTAGLYAKKTGLPIDAFIAATNINDTFPRYIQSGNYQAMKSRTTISNAMDVGDPSNFQRIMYLYDNDVNALKQDIWSASYTDEETRMTLKRVFTDENYLMDPHGAVGYLGLKNFLKQNNGYSGIFLETAHPSKFLEVVEETIGQKVEIPERLAILKNKEKEATMMENDYNSFKNYLMAGN